MAASLSTVEQGKRLAARAAVDQFVKDGMVIGVGSRSIVVYVAERVAERVRDEHLSLRCVATSYQAKQLIHQHHLTLLELDQVDMIDVTIDGADEIDASTLDVIKGGGGCMTQEKIVAAASRCLVIVADHRKRSERLNTQFGYVPVEVVPMAAPRLAALLNSNAHPRLSRPEADGGLPHVASATLRMAKAKAGPCVTDTANFIVDIDFGGISDPAAVEQRLTHEPGVVTVGLFIGMADHAFIGEEDGSVTTLHRRASST